VVVATAMKTELGRIAGMMESAGADESTPLEKKLESFGRVLVWTALGIVALLFGLGLLARHPGAGAVHDVRQPSRRRRARGPALRSPPWPWRWASLAWPAAAP